MSFYEATPSGFETPEHLRPIGMRTVGYEDPRQLSRAEFLESRSVLFHGAAKDFQFDPDFDYTDPKNIHENMSDGSMTLGSGLYTIPSLKEARNYAITRAPLTREQPRVVPFLPYQARILDLRSAAHPEQNGNLPHELMVAWVDRYKAELERREEALRAKERVTWLERTIYKLLKEYEALLDRLLETGRTFKLRTVLGTGNDRSLPFPTMDLPAPPWVHLWSRFMQDQGIDGLV